MLDVDATDERAHLALMRRHAANGDRHAALRQFERLDRTLRQELGVGPGPEASALRDRLLAAYDVFPRRDDPLIGRDLERSVAERALLDAAAGRGRALIVGGEAAARPDPASRQDRAQAPCRTWCGRPTAPARRPSRRSG